MNKKSKPKRTPELMFHTLKHPVKWYLTKRFNIKVIKNELPNNKEPFFLIGHHVTAFDAPIAGAYAPQMLRFIAGDANYDNQFKKFWLDLVGAIPFTKNKSDIKSIVKLKKLVKAGKSVSLYPEGGRNWDGSTDYLIPSTAKLIKLLKIPVYTIFYYGGYLSKPRWGQYFRKGVMELSFELLLSPSDIKSMSVEEIQKAMATGLSYNEYDWQKERMIPFKGKKLAEHVERLVYKCPECGGYDTFISDGDDFSCRQCNATYSLNVYGFIENCEQFDNLTDWNKWQFSYIEELYDQGFTFENEELLIDVIDRKTNTHNKQLCSLTLTKEAMTFACSYSSKTVPIKDIKGLSISFLDTMEFYIANKKYRLFFKPAKHTSVKLFYDMLKYMKNQIQSEE